MSQRVLIIGATSAIAQAVARLYAVQAAQLFLVARNQPHLATIGQDLLVRGADKVGQSQWDASDLNNISKVLNEAQKFLGQFDVVLIAHGSLPSQIDCETNVATALAEFNTNGLSVIAMLTELANIMEAQGAGTIAVISSVAGDRGRQSNYLYGSAKAAVSVFLQGLRARLYQKNISVLTIKPGFVDTPMTAKIKKNFLFASPEQVAKDIVKAIGSKKDVIYTPFFWKWIMLIIKLMPEFIAKKLRF